MTRKVKSMTILLFAVASAFADEGEETKKPKKDPYRVCLLYTSPSPRDQRGSRMPSSA